MTDKQIMINGVDILKEKINMCFILLLNKLETPETIEQTIYEHLDAFVKEWNDELVHKTQECEQIKEKYEALKLENQEGYEIVAELKHECEELKKGYAELTDIVAPYIDDFTGYNEELGGFDIVLCVKQLMEQLDQLKRKEQECEKGEGNGN